MNPLDLGVIAIIALSAIFAFARGFVREALSIIAWIGAAAITLYGFNWAYGMIDPSVHNPLLSQVIAGFGLFVVSLVILTILTGIVARTVHATGLTPIDRTLGFIFGLARGAFLVCLAYLLVDLSLPQPNDRPQWIREAKSAAYLHQGADILKGFLPESLKIKSADDVIKNLTPSEQTQQAIRAYVNPAPPPSAQPPASATPNYPAADRQQLNRVIGNQR
jgi:membrane protein required for colicin V production